MKLDLQPRQGVFSFQENTPYEKDDFILSECNKLAYQGIIQQPINAPFLILQGPKGSGKSHLARIWQETFKAKRLSVYDLEVIPAHDLLEGFAFFLMDSFPQTLNGALEEAFFHLYNEAKEQQKTILLVFQQSFSFYHFMLKDLDSRMKACPIHTIWGADDDILRFLLLKQLSDRQIQLEPHVVEFILKRIERQFECVLKLVAQIDKASLESQRKITIQLLKGLL